MLSHFLPAHGEEFQIIRGNVVNTVKGLLNSSPSSKRKYISFPPGTDINVDDYIIRVTDGNKWLVVEVQNMLIRGRIDSVDAYYETQYELRKRQDTTTTYSFNNSQNIIAGNQNSVTINVTYESIVADIEKNGGLDKEELLQIISEIKNIFEEKEQLPKGYLSKFSATLEKHSWITGSLVQLIGNLAISYFLSPK